MLGIWAVLIAKKIIMKIKISIGNVGPIGVNIASKMICGGVVSKKELKHLDAGLQNICQKLTKAPTMNMQILKFNNP